MQIRMCKFQTLGTRMMHFHHRSCLFASRFFYLKTTLFSEYLPLFLIVKKKERNCLWLCCRPSQLVLKKKTAREHRSLGPLLSFQNLGATMLFDIDFLSCLFVETSVVQGGQTRPTLCPVRFRAESVLVI